MCSVTRPTACCWQRGSLATSQHFLGWIALIAVEPRALISFVSRADERAAAASFGVATQSRLLLIGAVVI
jgi:hypothetical protein